MLMKINGLTMDAAKTGCSEQATSQAGNARGGKKKKFPVRSRNVYENKGKKDKMSAKTRVFSHNFGTFWYNFPTF